MPELKTCKVSYRDLEGIVHSAEVTASTLYEAAVLALKAFELTEWTEVPRGLLEVVVTAPVVKHQVAISQVTNWLRSVGSPREMMVKHRLKEILGWKD